jgi:hypothetical protein
LYLNGTLSNIAGIFWSKGELNQAFEYLERIYLNLKPIGNTWVISIALTNLVELSIDKEDLESANFYYNTLQKFNDQEENPFITEISIDDTYIGKFLTFFNTFTNQIFSESFDRVKFGQYTVLFTSINSLFIIYIFQGQTYGARQKLFHFTETIKKELEIKRDLESYYNMSKILNLNDNPLLEELITNSFMVNAQKLQLPFKAYTGDKKFVFVSYSHADKLQVYPIIDFLNKNGVRIWYDEGIPISEDWKKSIVDNLERCRAFLVFISPHVVNSEMVRKEISYALKKKKQFFAVYLKDTTLPSELEFEIADIQALMKYKLSEGEFYNKLKSIFEPIFLEKN